MPPMRPVPVPLTVSFPERVQMKPPVKISIPIAGDAFNCSPIRVSEPGVPMKLGGTVSLGTIKILAIRFSAVNLLIGMSSFLKEFTESFLQKPLSD